MSATIGGILGGLRSNRSRRRWSLGAFVVGGSTAAWFLVGAVLSPDRGLDTTDEGLALLFAEHPDRPSGRLPSVGRFTGPLWNASDGDLVLFRSLTGWLLVMTAATLGVIAVRMGRSLGDSTTIETSTEVPTFVLGAVLGGVAGFAYFATGPFFRAASYDWVNILGLTVAACGLLLLLTPTTTPNSDRLSNGGSVIGSALLGAGALLTVGGRPSSAPILGLVALVAVMRLYGRRAALAVVARMALAVVLTIGACVIADVWPSDVLRRFIDPLVTAITYGSGRSVTGSIVDLVRTPVDLVRASPALLVIPAVPALLRGAAAPRLEAVLRGTAFVVLVGLFALEAGAPPLVRMVHAGNGPDRIVALLEGRDEYGPEFYVDLARGFWRPEMMTVMIITLLGVWITRTRGGSRRVAITGVLMTLGVLVGATLTPPAGSSRLAASLLLMVAAAAVASGPWYSRSYGENASPLRSVHGPRSHIPVGVVALLVLAAASGFGTATGGPAGQMARAAPLLAASAGLLAASVPTGSRLRVIAVLTVAVAVVTAVQLTSAREYPYRSFAMSEQTASVVVGPRGTPLFVDEEIAHLLTSLAEGAAAAGWAPGTELLEASITSAPTLAWHLDARSPSNFLMWFGATDMLDATFDRVDAAEWAGAWLLTSGTEPGDAGDHRRRAEVVDEVTARLRTSFPADYERVWAFTSERRWLNLELWRPRSRVGAPR